MIPNRKNSNRATTNTVARTEEDDITVITDNRSRATSDGGPTTEARSERTSEGEVTPARLEEESHKHRKNKVKEKWKRKLLNRIKTKQERAQDKKNWGMARAVTRGEAWSAIVKEKEPKKLPNATMAFNNRTTTRLVEFAISNSGATAHFLVEGAPIVNKREAEQPVTIKLPDGTLIYSTHIGNLDIPWMPDSMTTAHIMPGLSHSSLISTKVFCDAGYKVTFND